MYAPRLPSRLSYEIAPAEPLSAKYSGNKGTPAHPAEPARVSNTSVLKSPVGPSRTNSERARADALFKFNESGNDTKKHLVGAKALLKQKSLVFQDSRRRTIRDFNPSSSSAPDISRQGSKDVSAILSALVDYNLDKRFRSCITEMIALSKILGAASPHSAPLKNSEVVENIIKLAVRASSRRNLGEKFKKWLENQEKQPKSDKEIGESLAENSHHIRDFPLWLKEQTKLKQSRKEIAQTLVDISRVIERHREDSKINGTLKKLDDWLTSSASKMLDFQIARELNDAKEAVWNAPNSATGKGKKRILQEIKDARKKGDPDVLICGKLFGTEWGKKDKKNLKKLLNAWGAVKALDSWKVWRISKIQQKKRAEKIAAEGAKFHELNENKYKNLPSQYSLTSILAMKDEEPADENTTLLTTKALDDIPPLPSLPPLPPMPTEEPPITRVGKTPVRDSLMIYAAGHKGKASTANRPPESDQESNPGAAST